MTRKIVIWIAALTPLVIVLLEYIWQYFIRPRRIPVHRITAMADNLVATYGPFAEHEAFLRQQNEWYRGDLLAQGTWMLVRRHLHMRWEANDTELFDAREADKILNAKNTMPP
ncbi:hypothetical protein [Pseudochelatococcus contaminans]|uniref:Uncharacterized protein n=1 Tax=Pseudochelatococcus contaminans TaxID=1538103 RepID=A0A7W5Z460_9HYPH|nr:hypothetical protein [Pseudochelatococcus contaminans]MBB3809843.1 hypothetical protein [Pseudochelatococcus contaminans]